MYKVIKQFCENGEEGGLFLLDMPTGFGKTTAVVQYIYDAVQRYGSKRKYFYLTTLKKNLPEEDLKNIFVKEGKIGEFYEKVLRISPNYESVIEGLTEETMYDIPNEIRESMEYKQLEQYVGMIKKLRKEHRMQSILKMTEERLRQDIEPEFRKYVQSIIKRQFTNITNVDERIAVIKEDRNWSWIGKLYPSVFLRQRQVILMSVDKFLSANSTMVEPSFYLYTSDIINNAVIFIDEFDATKETVLKNIIDNSLKDNVDYMKIFHSIHSSLYNDRHILPSQLTLFDQGKEKKNQNTLLDIIENTRNIADFIYDDFSLRYSLKAKLKNESEAVNFLFQDHRYYSVVNGKKLYVRIHLDKNNKQNIIEFSNKKPGDDNENVQFMLSRIRGLISFFMGAVHILAMNYVECKRNLQNSISIENAVMTILNEMNIDREYISYLTSKILSIIRRKDRQKPNMNLDLSFYENGFRYYSIIDSEEHDTISKIFLKEIRLTPEKLMLLLCQRAKVFGVSATATIPSVIGNYDIEYLKGKLQNKYVTLQVEDRERLKQEFQKSIGGYEKINIHTELIQCEYSDTEWKRLTAHEEVAKYLSNMVDRACMNTCVESDYNKERYLRIAIVFKEFIIKSEIKSFLCILTKFPRENDDTLDWNVLMNIFDVIIKERNVEFSVKGDDSNVVMLDSNDYEIKKERISERLSAGERIFVISTYQTIGAGQNIQYRVPEAFENSLIKVNDYPSRGYKDFDGIYLDLPTNLIEHFPRHGDEETLFRYICHIEMLREKGEISVHDAILLIKQALRKDGSRTKNNMHISINECQSILALSTRQIIQAIGRICRTNLKSEDIYIFADARIAFRMDYSMCRDRLLNREFEELLKALHSLTALPKNDNIEYLTNKAVLISLRVNKYIIHVVKEGWTEDRMEAWKALRDFTLRNPTLSLDQFNDAEIGQNFYIKLPKENDRVFYKQDNDFEDIEVYFSHMPKTSEVSEKASKLTALMKIDVIREHFLEMGYATAFERNEYIMCPPLFNNIYRGALGEVAGKVLFSICANVELEEITDTEVFEKFDFKVPSSSVYVDFKNWHEGTFKDSDSEITHIAKKAHKCNCKCVIVANIIAGEEWVIQEKYIEGVKIIIIPALVNIPDDKSEPIFLEMSWKRIRECICEYSD